MGADKSGVGSVTEGHPWRPTVGGCSVYNRYTSSHRLHKDALDTFDVAVNVAVKLAKKTARAREYPASKRGCEREVVSRLGFEPRTRGSKVPV
jgi:hypothetical protein